jgi:hypothetical protein
MLALLNLMVSRIGALFLVALQATSDPEEGRQNSARRHTPAQAAMLVHYT